MDLDIPVTSRGQVNLIQMPNGTGKSTIIDLMTAVLSEQKFGPKEVNALRSQDTPKSSGEFWVKVAIEGDSGRCANYKFGLRFDFDNNSYEHWTLRRTETGQEKGFLPPAEIESYLNSHCVDVFVFKGDKAEKLLDPRSADAEDAIKAFYGLSSIDELIKTIDQEFDNRPIEGGTTSRTLTKRKNKISEWQARLSALKKELRAKELELADFQSKMPDLERAYTGIISNNSEIESKRERLSAEKSRCVTAVSVQALEAFDALKNPFVLPGQLGRLMRELKNSFDTLKLPGTSLEFFKELSESESCVCGRALDYESRRALITNAKSYLSDEHVTVVNGIKKDITEYDSLTSNEHGEKVFKTLEQTIDDYERKKEQLVRLEANIKEKASEKDKEIIEQYRQLQAAISRIEQRIEDMKSPAESRIESIIKSGSPDLVNSIPSIEKVIKELRADLAEQEGIVADYEAKEVLKNVLESAVASALPRLANELTAMTNEKLAKILPAGTSIQIARITNHIQLSSGKPETQNEKEKGSGGENVAIAYSFASSVIEKSGVKFPLIVDHPVTALMSPARAKIGKILAKIGHQFTGFIIDTERQAFVEAIEESGCEVNYFTIYRDIDGNKHFSELLPKNEKLFERTSNAVICTDKKFFWRFQEIERNQ